MSIDFRPKISLILPYYSVIGTKTLSTIAMILLLGFDSPVAA